MKEQLEMFIAFDTSLEDIEILRKEMEAFVRDPENSRDFQPDVVLECTGICSMDKLQLKVEIRHKSNWSNETVRAARRSKFMCALVLALRKVPIYPPGGGGLHSAIPQIHHTLSQFLTKWLLPRGRKLRRRKRKSDWYLVNQQCRHLMMLIRAPRVALEAP